MITQQHNMTYVTRAFAAVLPSWCGHFILTVASAMAGACKAYGKLVFVDGNVTGIERVKRPVCPEAA